MDIRAKIRSVLREQYGTFDTYLECKYEATITENLIMGDANIKQEWVTYNQAILELKHSVKDLLKVKELQYKLTDNEDPNVVCIQVLEAVKDRTPELERLYYKISNFR